MLDEVEEIRKQYKNSLTKIANRFVKNKQDEPSEAEQNLVNLIKGKLTDSEMNDFQNNLESIFGRKLKIDNEGSFFYGNVEGHTPKSGKGKVIYFQYSSEDCLVLSEDDSGELSISNEYDLEIANNVKATAEQICEFLSYLSPVELNDFLKRNYDEI